MLRRIPNGLAIVAVAPLTVLPAMAASVTLVALWKLLMVVKRLGLLGAVEEPAPITRTWRPTSAWLKLAVAELSEVRPAVIAASVTVLEVMPPVAAGSVKVTS